MKRSNKVALGASAAVLVLIIEAVGCAPKPTLAPPTSTPTPELAAVNLYAVHLEANSYEDEQCLDCHENVADDTSVNGTIPGPHSVHETSELLSFQCASCHERIDLSGSSAASLRRQVDAELCANCHSPLSSEMHDAGDKEDCMDCHDDWQEVMKDTPNVKLDAVTAENCLTCHDSRSWYQDRGGE